VGFAEGTASFERWAARLAGCPLRVNAGPVGLRPCAFFELGSLQGNGSQTADPAHPAVLWMAFGAAARAEALLFGRFVVGVDAGALIPLKKDDFYFDPTQDSVFHTGSAGFVGSFDVGVRFL